MITCYSLNNERKLLMDCCTHSITYYSRQSLSRSLNKRWRNAPRLKAERFTEDPKQLPILKSKTSGSKSETKIQYLSPCETTSIPVCSICDSPPPPGAKHAYQNMPEYNKTCKLEGSRGKRHCTSPAFVRQSMHKIINSTATSKKKREHT